MPAGRHSRPHRYCKTAAAPCPPVGSADVLSSILGLSSNQLYTKACHHQVYCISFHVRPDLCSMPQRRPLPSVETSHNDFIAGVSNGTGLSARTKSEHALDLAFRLLHLWSQRHQTSQITAFAGHLCSRSSSAEATAVLSTHTGCPHGKACFQIRKRSLRKVVASSDCFSLHAQAIQTLTIA